MSEQVVDFLEPVEIKAQHSQTPAGTECCDFPVDPRVEVTAVGKRGERVVMREKMNAFFGSFARLKIANCDHVARQTGINDRPHDQFDRRQRTVDTTQIGFYDLIRSRQQLGAGLGIGKAVLESFAGKGCGRKPGQKQEAFVGRNDRLAVANQETFDRSIRQFAHPFRFKIGAAMIANVEHDAGHRQTENGQACHRHPYREPSRRQGCLGNFNTWVGNDRHRGHRGEVMATDCKRQEQCTADFPALAVTMYADGKRDRADHCANQYRGGNKNRVPQHLARDLESRHSGVMHRGDPACNDSTADPRGDAPVWNKRHGEPGAGQNDGRDQREDG
jgi:hypothetical protein